MEKLSDICNYFKRSISFGKEESEFYNRSEFSAHKRLTLEKLVFKKKKKVVVFSWISFELTPCNPISVILPPALTTLNFDYCKRPLISPLASCWCCSVAKLCLTLSDPMYYSMQGFPVLHHLQEFAQTHVHWVSDAIQPPHPLLPPSPFAFNPSQHQSLFQWVNSSHEVAKVLEFQLQHHSLQRNPIY